MAKKQQSPASSAPRAAAPSEPVAPPRRAVPKLTIVVLVLAAGAGIFVSWRRQRDPARVWARQVAQAHEQKLVARIGRCFGGADGAAIRALIPTVRQGQWPAPLLACQGAVLTEVVTAPMVFGADLLEPPGSAESAQVRARDRLERLRGSLANLQNATSRLPREGTLPEEARDRIATALEDVAVDVDAERTSLGDVIRAAESGASFF